MRKYQNKQGVIFLAELYDPENPGKVASFVHLFDRRINIIYEFKDIDDSYILISKDKNNSFVLSDKGEKAWVCWDPINKSICYRYDKYLNEHCIEMLL